jgi:hypothetical protein
MAAVAAGSQDPRAAGAVSPRVSLAAGPQRPALDALTPGGGLRPNPLRAGADPPASDTPVDRNPPQPSGAAANQREPFRIVDLPKVDDPPVASRPAKGPPVSVPSSPPGDRLRIIEPPQAVTTPSAHNDPLPPLKAVGPLPSIAGPPVASTTPAAATNTLAVIERLPRRGGTPTPSDPRPASSAAEGPVLQAPTTLTQAPQGRGTVAVATSPAVLPKATVDNPPAHSDATERKREKFDPLKVNGPIFLCEDEPGKPAWPKPKLALVFSGRQDGYFEPCGCAGIGRMKGGMARRDDFFKKLRTQYQWTYVAMDVGGLAKGLGRQAELKFQAMVEALNKMKYSASGLGINDLELPSNLLIAYTAVGGGLQSPFCSANVGFNSGANQFDPSMLQTYRVIEAAGMRIGATSILGKSYRPQIRDPFILTADAEAKLAALLPEMKKNADYLVLLAYATSDESKELARKFPDFKVVVTAGGADEPPGIPETIAGTQTPLIEVGYKATNVIVLGLYDGPKPWRYQRVPLDSRFGDSPRMQQVMADYQDQLKTLGFEGLGLHSGPHPQQSTLKRFVGSDKCESCHDESFKVWKKTPHAHAYRTLADLPVSRVYDPECISCHVVGWDPQNFLPYTSGYRSRKETPQLINVGCESCHGPGEAHVEAEMGKDVALQLQLQKAVRITKDEARKQLMCQNCHDGDNSPDFEFDSYFPHIEHHEKE